MEINYIDIGARVRHFRVKKEMTQEKLAEFTKLSTPHISHIENGTTKLGLPTIVKIANVLNVTVDKLLCDSLVFSQHIYNAELSELLSDCSPYELRSMIDMLIAVKKIMRNRKNYEV